MGKRSRNKGQRGENQVRDLLRDAGFEATRHRIGAANDDLLHNIPGVSIEVKYQQAWQIPAWLRQCEEQAGDKTPVLFFRKNHQPWRVIVPAEHYLALASNVAKQGEEHAEPDRRLRPES